MKISSADLAAILPSYAEHLPEGTPARHFLNIGAGAAGASSASRLPECLRSPSWQEVRLDIDPQVKPDIVGDARDLARIASGSFDAVYSSHNLEHLEGPAVAGALAEMHRILTPGGVAIITLPSLEGIAKLILAGKLTEAIYQSPSGPITPLDMLFGHQRAIARGNLYMAHRTGFTAAHLQGCLVEAGFSEVRVRAGNSFDLWAIAIK